MYQPLDALPHRAQAECFGAQFVQRNPTQAGCIIVGLHLVGIGNAAQEEGIGRMDGVCAEGLRIGLGEPEVGREEFGPHFFMQFAGQSVGDALTRVDKAARQVERAFGRFAATHHTEQLVKVVDHYSHGGCGGIGVEREAAVSTPFAVGIVRFEAAAAAVRAVQEVVKGM